MGQSRVASHTRGRESGAVAAEFAIVLPVLLLLLLGIINFGYVFGQKLSLNQAVREGARKAVVSDTASPNDIDAFVRDSTGGLISPTSSIAVTSEIQNATTATGSFIASPPDKVCVNYDKLGGQLKVTATYQASWLIVMPLPIGAPSLTSEAVFRCELIS